MSASTVGINLLWLVPGVVGGSEQLTLASLRAMRDLAPPDLDFRLFVLEPFGAAYPDVVEAFATEVLPLSGRSRAVRVAAEASWLAARTRGFDLVHHAGGTAPPLRGAPYVLTIHDIQPLERRATHGRLKRAYLTAVVPRSVRAARRVAVPSEFVRRSVLARVEVDPASLVVISPGVDASAVPTPPDALVDRYGIDGPVVLYPAITYPHKNHAVLVDAFALVLHDHPDALLVLPGGRGACEDELRAHIARLGLQERVRRTDRIPDADVAGLYAAASVVALPSRYEGFGLPAAEAMAAGVALVAAAVTALPEVVGDAGVLVDPDDPVAWADAIGRLLGDPAERARLVARGHERVQRYSWRANAEAYAELYRGALADR